MKTENESQTTNESSERAMRAKDLVRMIYDAVAATDDLERENAELRDQLEVQRAVHASAIKDLDGRLKLEGIKSLNLDCNLRAANLERAEMDRRLKVSEAMSHNLAVTVEQMEGLRGLNEGLQAQLAEARNEADELRQKMESGLVYCHDDHEFSKSALAVAMGQVETLRRKLEESEKREPCTDCQRESKKYRQIASDLETRVAAAEQRTAGLLQRIAAYELRLDVGPFGDKVATEILRARSIHKPLNSTHEGYSVLLEEVEEFWEEVRKKSKDRDRSKMLDELVQVGAMAQRIAEDCLGSPVVVKGKA